MVKILAAAAAVAIVIAGIGVYLFVSAGASASVAERSAGSVLKTIDSDTTQIDKSLQMPKMPGLRSADADFSGAKQTFDVHLTQIDQTRSMVAADQAKLRSTRDKLRTERANLLALTSRSALDHELSRVVSMRSALDEADAALMIERNQARALSALCDALMNGNVLFDRINKQDPVGAISRFSGVQAKLIAAADLAKADGVPMEVGLLISAFQSFLADLLSVFQASARNDMAALKSLSARIDADAKAAESVNPDRFDALGQALVIPHADRYHASLRAAGFPASGPVI